MTNDEMQIHELLHRGESVNLEFKTCRERLGRDVYETVCAFLNRHGGTLVLGISDDRTITGVEPAAVAQMRQDFGMTMNNPQKIHPPPYLTIEEVRIAGMIVLRIYVPESSQVHRCNGRIFDRNEDGDIDVTDNTRHVSALYQRKQETYSENRIYPHARMEDLRRDLIARSRRLASATRTDHPWLDLDDVELLRSAQLLLDDPQTGAQGITLAGILLLGTDRLILSALPHHRTDLILRRVNIDRYDDRDFVDTNLIESYDRIMGFVMKHLPDPFHLDGHERVSIRDVIFREVASNLLIHREYRNPYPAKMVIERDRVHAENSNKAHGWGVLHPLRFVPYPKNPVIARFFRQIGRADELGSGMRKLMRYGTLYGGSDPQLIEGDVFHSVIAIPEPKTIGNVHSTSTLLKRVQVEPEGVQVGVQVEPEGVQVGVQVEPEGVQVGVQVEPEGVPPISGLNGLEVRILRLCLDEARSPAELRSALGYSSRNRSFRKAITFLINMGLVEYSIPSAPNSRLQRYRITSAGARMMR